MKDKIEDKLEEVEQKGRKVLKSPTRRRNILIGVVAVIVLSVIAVYAFREDLPDIPITYRGE